MNNSDLPVTPVLYGLLPPAQTNHQDGDGQEQQANGNNHPGPDREAIIKSLLAINISLY